MGFIMEMTDIMEASETEEEQKRIHAFWSDLSDTERQRLAVLDRDVLLKRLKEQQRYTCHCSICDKHT